MAKEQKQENPSPVPEVPEVAGPPKSYRLYISLGFVCLILFQVIIVFLIMPAKQAQPRAGIGPGDGTVDFDVVSERSVGIRSEVTVEKQIGEKNTFKIRTSRGDLTDAFSVVMHVTVRRVDERAFDKQYLDRTMRVIDRVTSVLDASTREEREEATRTAIKERVKQAINEVLGTPWVQEVLFTEVVHEVT